MDPLDAVRLPRIFTAAGNRQVQLEHGFTPRFLQEIRAMGYEPVAEGAGYARLYVIARCGNAWVGVADTRHDGQPRGYQGVTTGHGTCSGSAPPQGRPGG